MNEDNEGKKWWEWLLRLLIAAIVLFVFVMGCIAIWKFIGHLTWTKGTWFVDEVTPTGSDGNEPNAGNILKESDGDDMSGSAEEFLRNFNLADEDFTGMFGNQTHSVVFIMTDAERLSCVIPVEEVETYADKFGWDIFEDVYMDGDTIETDVIARISSVEAEDYVNCWEIPVVENNFFRAMVVQNPLDREAELEATTEGIVYTVLRNVDSLEETSIPEVLPIDTTEYKDFNVIVVRYQLSSIDIDPAYIFPTWSPYIAP